MAKPDNKPVKYEGPDIVVDDLEHAGLSAEGPARLKVVEIEFQQNKNKETGEPFVMMRGQFKVTARPSGDLKEPETLFDNFSTSKRGLWKFRDMLDVAGLDPAAKGKSLQAHARDLKGRTFVCNINHQVSQKNGKTYEALKSFRKNFQGGSGKSKDDDL